MVIYLSLDLFNILGHSHRTVFQSLSRLAYLSKKQKQEEEEASGGQLRQESCMGDGCMHADSTFFKIQSSLSTYLPAQWTQFSDSPQQFNLIYSFTSCPLFLIAFFFDSSIPLLQLFMLAALKLEHIHLPLSRS